MRDRNPPTPYFASAQYIHAGCMQFERGFEQLGTALWTLTEGKMCAGCPKYNGGRCESFRMLQAGAHVRGDRAAAQHPIETVRQEALRLGVSISEVRRRRNTRRNN